MVRQRMLTSLEKRSNLAQRTIGPETPKTLKEDSFSKPCARGLRLVG